MAHRLNSIRLKGYRPFRDLVAHFDPLVTIVGANGAGKSSLFEFFRFLRDAVHSEIPPEIVPGAVGQKIFHVGGPERFWWSLDIDTGHQVPLRYQGELVGPVRKKRVSREAVKTAQPLGDHDDPYVFMDIHDQKGVVQNVEGELEAQDIELQRPNQLALGAMTNPQLSTLYDLRDYIRGWRFYNAFDINNRAIRKSIPIEQNPVLHEDGSNLSSVLHSLMTEHPGAFEKLERHLRRAVPGFRGLTVKPRGAPGEVIAFWQEESVDQELSLADLSDGILRLMCWMTLAVQPDPPPLICIDEPAQGVHPRTLPILAGLFRKATARTQLLFATHSSYFLSQFDAEEVAVMRKQDGQATYARVSGSDVLSEMLEEFGNDELEAMHRSDELEVLS